MNHVKRISFCIAFCFSFPAAAAVNIELEVDNSVNPPTLVVTKNNAQCTGGPIACIEVKPGTNPHMFFTLKKACSGVDYKLSKFRIAEKNKQWPTSTNPLPLDISKDFCADRNTGYVDFRYCSNSLSDKKMKLKNFNSKPADVFYEVTAMHCTNDEEIYLDPQIKNGGRGRN